MKVTIKDLYINFKKVIILFHISYLIFVIILMRFSVNQITEQYKHKFLLLKDLYKISQIIERNIVDNQIDCVKIVYLETNFSYLDATKKKECFFLNKIFLGIIYLVTTFILLRFLKKMTLEKSLKLNLENSNAELYLISKKMAHDIRSPISTLNLISGKIGDDQIKELHRNVVRQINAIAGSFLSMDKKLNEKKVLLTDIIELLEAEYNLKKSEVNAEIKFKVLENTQFGLFSISKELSDTLYSVLNNFLRNSIEATSTGGIISVLLDSTDQNNTHIILKDNGVGMPEHIRLKLGHEPISFGKLSNGESGSGIGVFNSVNELRRFGISVQIFSIQNSGTKSVITIPRAVMRLVSK